MNFSEIDEIESVEIEPRVVDEVQNDDDDMEFDIDHRVEQAREARREARQKRRKIVPLTVVPC